MIYDSKKIEDLIRRYQAGEEEVLEAIIKESTSLVEVIVSKRFGRTAYDRDFKEDMIQECLVKIISVLGNYNPDIAKAHSYFTSVITNHCNDCVNKRKKQDKVLDRLKIEPGAFSAVTVPPIQEHLLVELKERNRKRFPSIPVNELDVATEYIYHAMLNGVYGKSQGAIKELNETYGMNRHVAMILYHSSLVYLRHKYHRQAKPSHEPPKEISLLPELKEIVGAEAYEYLTIVMSGTYVRFP